jgi:hypothetical protein
MAIMVIRSAARILAKAVIVNKEVVVEGVSIYIQAKDNHETLRRVLGKAQMNETINPTIPNTIEQVPWSVTVSIMTLKVKI